MGGLPVRAAAPRPGPRHQAGFARSAAGAPPARDRPEASGRAAAPRPCRRHLSGFASIRRRRATSPGPARGVGARSGTAPGSAPPGRLRLDRQQARRQPGTGQRRRCAQRHRARVGATWAASPRSAAGAPRARDWPEASVRVAAPRPGRRHLGGFAPIASRRTTSPGPAEASVRAAAARPRRHQLAGAVIPSQSAK
jgi:hypothetical protein